MAYSQTGSWAQFADPCSRKRENELYSHSSQLNPAVCFLQHLMRKAATSSKKEVKTPEIINKIIKHLTSLI